MHQQKNMSVEYEFVLVCIPYSLVLIFGSIVVVQGLTYRKLVFFRTSSNKLYDDLSNLNGTDFCFNFTKYTTTCYFSTQFYALERHFSQRKMLMSLSQNLAWHSPIHWTINFFTTPVIIEFLTCQRPSLRGRKR